MPADERAKSVFQGRVDVATATRIAIAERNTAEFAADRSAEIDLEKAETETHQKWATANREADIANLHEFSESLSTLAVGAVDRARSGAEMVQKASAAVVTLYTGILALVFSVTDNPLPARGVLAPLFLGLAVVLSTAYVAYLGPKKGYSPGPKPVLGLEPKVFQRLNAVTAVASKIATRRAWSLRAAVVSLGIGLAYIILPFVSFAGPSMTSPRLQTELAWPAPAMGIPNDLNAVLFKAQVDEVAAARTAAAVTTVEEDGGVLLGFGLTGLALVIFVPYIWRD